MSYTKLSEEINKWRVKTLSDPFRVIGEHCYITGLPLNEFIYLHIEDKKVKVHPDIKTLNNVDYVEFEGELYDYNTVSMVRLKDDSMVPVDRAKYIIGYGYTTNVDGYLKYKNEYYKPEDEIITEDTGIRMPRQKAYESNGKYYQFPELSGEYSHPMYYNYTEFEDSPDRCIGIELEFGDSYELQKRVLKDDVLRKHFKTTRDGSLDEICQGIEFVSIPLKLSEVEPLLTRMLEAAKQTGADPHDHCGFHVHVSGENISFFDLTSLVTFCKNNEDEIFKLLPKSRENNKYCKRLSGRFDGFTIVKTPSDRIKAGKWLYSGNNAKFETRHENGKYIDGNGQRGVRYYWLNLDRMFMYRKQPHLKTVEFRLHHATLNAKEFISFVHLCYYIVEFAKNKSRKTCMNSTLKDVYEFAKFKHQKIIKKICVDF